MEFCNRPYIPKETIAAIATPPGEGGIAVIRITGENALSIGQKIFSKDLSNCKSHKALYGQILNAQGDVVDDVLLLPMLGKKSYAGEETVEIFCHGGSLIARKVLECVLQAGARQALPGEFTFKAFMNGKLDLSQAEAVQELIHAKNERMLAQAENQLQGKLSEAVQARQTRLNVIAAILEAWVDFPDEGLEFEPMEKVISDIEEEVHFLEKLISTYHDGKIIHEGLKVALIGAPNVGKSSLMNALLSKERAIVSPIAGTTRDILEDQMRLAGLNILLTDTAGLRKTDELIEKEGIRRSHRAMNEADLILLILDASRPITREEKDLLEEARRNKTIVIWNKIDQKISQPELTAPYIVEISALHKIGLDELVKSIDSLIWKEGPPSKEEIVITSVRHKEALLLAQGSFKRAAEGLKSGVSPEFVAFDMREGLTSLGQIIGANITEDILSAIFNKFCIGK